MLWKLKKTDYMPHFVLYKIFILFVCEIAARFIIKKNNILLIYDLQSENWINTFTLKCFLKARRPPKVSNEMKCTNEKMTYPGYEPEFLDHSATTSSAWYISLYIMYHQQLNEIYCLVWKLNVSFVHSNEIYDIYKSNRKYPNVWISCY